MEPAASEASDLTAGSKPNWLWIGGLLTGLFAIHAAVCAFLSPIGGLSNDIHGIKLMLFIGSMGITIGQPSLLAICAIFAPTRWTTRFIVSGAIVVLLESATLWGVVSGFADHRVQLELVTALFGLALGFLVAQLPYWAIRRIGHWRIVLPNFPTFSKSPGKGVSLRGMMLAVTIFCVLAAISQYSMHLVVWKTFTLSRRATETILVAFLSAAGSLPMMPFVGMVLAVDGWRKYRVASFIGVMVAEAILLVFVAFIRRPGITMEDVLIGTSLLVGGYGSGLITLLVVRACGFRLVREPVEQQAIDDATASAAMIVSAN